MSEHRSGTRKRILKAGRIEFGAGTVECVVRNISASGALVEVESCLGIPTEFDLLVMTDGLRQRSHVAWRKEKRLGLRFWHEPALKVH